MDELTEEASPHFIHSTLRERIVEHLFIGEALRRLWQRGITDVEILRSEFDAGGYDLVMSRGKITRHIQFKSMMVDGKAARTSISLKLMDKPSGCVIWIVVTPELNISSYLWFGGEPGESLPDISGFQITKHSKGNSAGTKAEKPNHRIVPRGKFKKHLTLDDVLERLFGTLPVAASGDPRFELPPQTANLVRAP
jgi:hypothetical protein